MFFKKNKPEKPQETKQQDSEAFGAPANVSASFSVFAPGLNPTAAPIDFGFNQPSSPPAPSYVVPAPPPDTLSQPQPVEPDWNANPVPPAEDFFTQPPSQENWESAPKNAFSTPSFVDTPPSDWEGPTPTVLPMGFLDNAPENAAYLGETFENYTIQAQSIETDAADAWQPPSEMLESPYSLSSFENPAFMESMSEVMPPPVSFEPSNSTAWPEPSSDFSVSFETPPAVYTPESSGSAMGDLMPWEQSAPGIENFTPSPSPEVLWQNLDSGETPPGEQVPLFPGGMMDAMHQKLYPEDPFHTEQADLMEGQQAFEDAAQFLFPDTMSAPLDWQEDTADISRYDLPIEFQLPDDAGFAPAPVNLGPSVQSDPSSLSDITSFYPEDSRPVAPEPVTSPLPADEPFAFPLEQDASFFSMDESTELASTFGLSSGENMESLDNSFSIPDAFDSQALPYEITPEANHAALADYTEGVPGFDLAPQEIMFEPSAPLYLPETTPANLEGFSLEPVSDDSLDEVTPKWELSPEPSAPENNPVMVSPEWAMPEEALDSAITPLESSPTDDWFESEMAFEETLLGESSPVPTDDHFEVLSDVQSAMPRLLSDQDFYATDFTLNEFGELVPSSDSAVSPMPASEISSPIQAETNWGHAPSLPAGEFESSVIPDDLGPPFQEAVSEFQVSTPTTEASQIEHMEPEPDAFFENWFAESSIQKQEIAPQRLLPDEKSVLPFEDESLPDLFAGETNSTSLASPDFLPDTSDSPFSQISLPPMPPARLPETPLQPSAIAQSLPTPQAQPTHPPDSLEGQWQQAPAAEPLKTTQASTVSPPAGFSLGNVEVLGVCPLAADRRLLVVNSGGVFALMGQVGLEEPQITVLKIFENNPLAYQNTFTAVAEAQAAAQGMFVTQVGTWHAIVSTFQDKITLHTELG